MYIDTERMIENGIMLTGIGAVAFALGMHFSWEVMLDISKLNWAMGIAMVVMGYSLKGKRA